MHSSVSMVCRANFVALGTVAMTRTLDVEDLASALYQGIALVSRRLRLQQAVGQRSMPERSALSRLDRGGPAGAAELARAEQITPQAMSVTLAALQQQGYVERRSDPHARWRVVMVLTTAGRQMLRRKRDVRNRQFAQALGDRFTPTELETLAAAAPLLDRLAESL